MKPRWGCAGFTLVEMLVATVVFALIGVGLMVMTTSGDRARVLTDTRLETLNIAQRAMNRLKEDLRAASQASVNNTPPNQCQTDALSFLHAMPPPQDRITYTRDATGTLTRTHTPGDGTPATPLTITTGLVALTPTCGSGGRLVTLTLTSRYQPPDGHELTQTIRSRVWVQSQ